MPLLFAGICLLLKKSLFLAKLAIYVSSFLGFGGVLGTLGGLGGGFGGFGGIGGLGGIGGANLGLAAIDLLATSLARPLSMAMEMSCITSTTSTSHNRISAVIARCALSSHEKRHPLQLPQSDQLRIDSMSMRSIVGKPIT